MKRQLIATLEALASIPHIILAVLLLPFFGLILAADALRRKLRFG